MKQNKNKFESILEELTVIKKKTNHKKVEKQNKTIDLMKDKLKNRNLVIVEVKNNENKTVVYAKKVLNNGNI